jgi:gliding motility-associated-like protein
MKKNILFLVIFLNAIFTINAQIDTEFWFVAPEITQSQTRDRPIFLVFATLDEAATIQVWQPADLTFTPIVVSAGPNSTAQINLTPFIERLENKPHNTVLKKGLLIRSTAPITAYYDVRAESNSDIFALKGANANGTKFFTPFQTHWQNALTNGGFVYNPTCYTAFDIIATDDTTLVTITPTIDIEDHLAGVPFTISLQRGETYSCRAIGHLGANNPVGTKIESTKPIAVTLKDDMLQYDPAISVQADMAGDQLIPVEYLGDEYIVTKGELTNNTDRIVIVATENNTDVFVNGNATAVATLSEGQSYVHMYATGEEVAYITSSKNIYVFHYSGQGLQLAGAIIPSLKCTGSDRVSLVRATNGPFYIYLAIKNGFQGNFELNGIPGIIQASSFTVVPGTNNEWVYAYINLTTNPNVPAGQSFRITNFSTELFAMGTINRSNGFTCNYGYFSNFSKLNLGLDRALCFGDSTILDAGPGKTFYLWSTGDTTQRILANTPGTYWVQTLSGEGCPLTDTVDVFFYEPPINLGGRDTICEGSTLLLSPPGVFLYEWQDGSTENTFLVEGAGEYWVEITDFQGCKTRDTLIVETSPRPETPVISGNNEICEGDQVILSMQPIVEGATYRWLGPNNTIYSGQNLNLGTLSTDASGTFYGFYIVEGCESFSDSIDVLIKPSPIVYLGLNDTICDNTPIILNPNVESGTFLWQDNSTDSTFTVSSSGIYAVQVTNEFNCVRSDTISIEFSEVPITPVVLGQSLVCDGGNISLSITAQPGVIYTWTGPDNFQFVGNAINIQNVDPGNSGVYTVNAVLNGCSSEPVLTEIAVNPNPVIEPIEDVVICAGETTILDAGEGFFNYQWSTNESTQTITVGTGTYYIQVGNIFGCVDFDTVVVSESGPTAAFSVNPPNGSQPGANIQFTDESTPSNGAITSWAWDFGDSQSSEAQNPLHVYNTQGIFTVNLTVTDEFGCSDETEITYTISSELLIPNSFTPNGDGFNDFFKILGLEIFPDSKLVIYNRWGNVVYNTNNYTNDWDANGAPDGVYFYILELNNGDKYNGEITILR